MYGALTELVRHIGTLIRATYSPCMMPQNKKQDINIIIIRTGKMFVGNYFAQQINILCHFNEVLIPERLVDNDDMIDGLSEITHLYVFQLSQKRQKLTDALSFLRTTRLLVQSATSYLLRCWGRCTV